MSCPARVLHVITRMNVGGAGGFVLDMCRMLPRDEFDCRILSGPEPDYEGSLEPACAEAGVELIRSPQLLRRPDPWRDGAAARHIASMITAWQPALIHTHTAKAGFLGRWVAHRRGVPAVHHIHGWTFAHQRPALLRRGFRWMEARAARWSRKLLAVCRADLRRGLEAGIGREEQYEVVPAGIDVEGVRREAECPPSDLVDWKGELPLLAFIGRYSEQKDPLCFIDAAHYLESARPGGQRFLMVGDGPLAERVMERLGSGPARSVTRTEGFRSDVARVLGCVDVLVHPSRHEGLPRMLLEAFAAGVPVVGTAVDGCAEILRDGETALTPPREPAAFAQGAARLLETPDLARRLTSGARALLPGYEITACAERLAGVYRDVLREGDRE
jgi:glycosyltransferase involved in cell wall biosynthesis